MDAETGFRTYGRTVGGIAWPGEAPGCAVVVGEDWYPPIGRTLCECHLLAEHESYDLHDLIRACAEMGAKHDVLTYYGRWVQQPCWALRDYNAGLDRAAARQMDFQVAPFTTSSRTEGLRGDISYHVNVLKSRLRPESKTLVLGQVKDSRVTLQLSQLAAANTAKLTDETHPALAALGYAVTFLTSFPSTWDPRAEQTVNPMTEMRSKVTGY